MAENKSRWMSEQVRMVRERVRGARALPFQDLLNTEMVAQVVRDTGAAWRDCGWTPEVTVWTFLTQVLSSDHSCRDAVAKLKIQQLSDRQIPVSPQHRAVLQGTAAASGGTAHGNGAPRGSGVGSLCGTASRLSRRTLNTNGGRNDDQHARYRGESAGVEADIALRRDANPGVYESDGVLPKLKSYASLNAASIDGFLPRSPISARERHRFHCEPLPVAGSKACRCVH